MRSKIVIAGALMLVTATVAPTMQAHAIVWVIVKAVVKKVIKAIDLAVQRVQNKTIKLQNLQRALENELSKLKLDEIGDWAKKQKDLYKEYFDELAKVKALIAAYEKIKSIILAQKDVVEQYNITVKHIRSDKNFSEKEVTYMLDVCEAILEESIKNVQELTLVVNSLSTTMSDGERLQLIDKADKNVQKNLDDIRRFNNTAFLHSLGKAQDQSQVDALKILYGIK
jgi:hypothetical protein